jgi:hypothetical protein
LGVGEEGGWHVDTLLPLPQVRGWTARIMGGRDEVASTPCLEPPAIMWSSHCLTSAPA